MTSFAKKNQNFFSLTSVVSPILLLRNKTYINMHVCERLIFRVKWSKFVTVN